MSSSFYTIITGNFKYDWQRINRENLHRNWVPWQQRIEGGDFQSTFDHLDKNYYDTYITDMFPDVRSADIYEEKINSVILYHYTHKGVLNTPISFSLEIDGSSFSGKIPYIDIYLFPNGIGLFSMKFEMIDSKGITLEYVSGFLKTIRQATTYIQFDAIETKLNDFVKNNVIHEMASEGHWDRYNPQFKTYTIIDLKENTFSEEEVNNWLYDIGNVSPPGSAKGSGPYAPAPSYFQHQMHEYRISVFKNWSALCLFDTFTRISQNLPDQHKVWEYDYFHIYIHTLYMKSFMYLTNTDLSDVTKATRQTGQIKDKFVEFINDYYLSHISYKFMPNLLYEKMMVALEIRKEVEMMEKKIQRINESFQKRREVTLNTALTIIIFLSLFSVITDLSSWLEELGINREYIYPYSSVVILIAVLAVLIVILIFRKK